MEDIKLAYNCKKGKPQAQKLLYDRFAKKMFGVCLRYAQNREDAEDYLQDGFTRVFKNIHQYAGTGSLEGWIRKVIVNTILESIRKRKSILFVGIDETQEDTGYDILKEKYDAEYLLASIQGLSDGYRTIFNLYAVEGYSHYEIASLLGISESTSKSQLSRARKILQGKLTAGLTKTKTNYYAG